MKDILKFICEKILKQIEIAESKFSITIALATGVIIYATSFLSFQNTFSKILSSACIALSLISVIYSFLALSVKQRNVKTKKIKNWEKENLLHYKSIIRFDENTYLSVIQQRYNFPNEYTPDFLDIDLAKQIIGLAKSLNYKYMFFGLSLIFLICSVILGVILALIFGVGGFF